MKRTEFKFAKTMESGDAATEAESVPVESETPAPSQVEENPELPILKYREEIVAKINEANVTIITAATGSGKVKKCLIEL